MPTPDGPGAPVEGAAPITGPCPAPLDSAADVALTPRADTNLELLALSLEADRITVSQATYERVVSDVVAIRALAPEVADVTFNAFDATTLRLQLTDIGASSVAEGGYSAWDCLNERYGLMSITPLEADRPTYEVVLKGNYNVERLAMLYSELPEVVEVLTLGVLSDWSTICGRSDGARYEYVVDRRSGDCPAGCAEHEAHHFESSEPGQVTALGVWQSGPGSPAPEWFSRICF